MNDLNLKVDKLINYEANNISRNKQIQKIDDQINFKYNSFNIYIGKQGTGKTTSILKELIKLSNIKNDYHLIIYVSDSESDDMFNRLKYYINIPIVKTDYQSLNPKFEQLIKLKDVYNKMIDGEIPKDNSILNMLYIKDFNKERLHTYILMDDAAFVLNNKENENEWFKWLCKLRHLNCTVGLCIQIWTSIKPSLKSQITSINIFKGYSKQQLNYIYRQIAINVNFNEFMKMYNKLGYRNKFDKLIIDCVEGEIRID